MKVIVAGTRSYSNREEVFRVLNQNPLPISEVVSGGCRGVDSIAEEWAEEKGIPVKQFSANWDEHGKAAGPIRNRKMAEYADALIAIWDGESSGTENMIDEAKSEKLPYVIYWRKDESL